MSSELELVQAYMAGGDDEPELSGARAILNEAMAAEDATMKPRTRSRSRRWAIRLSVVGTAAAASAVLILQLVPTGTTNTPVAAAAQLARLAGAAPPAPALRAGQWSTYRMQGVVTAQITTVGTLPTPAAAATIPLSSQVWSDATGSTCTSQEFGTASFASPVNAQAWHAIGLTDTPANQPVTGCVAGREASWAGSSAVIDVSTLTHDPRVLATELQAGTTGIQALDDAARGDSPHVAGFIRLTFLLVGPTTGQWSGWGREMLRTMSLLPGVIALGDRTSHEDRTGPAFTVGEQVVLNPRTGAVEDRWKGPTLILDAKTGALLEARTFNIPLLQSAGQDFVGSPDAAVVTQGVGYGVTTDWVDPVGGPHVVDADAVPGWISGLHVIEAVTRPDVPESEISAVINPFLGDGNMDGTESGPAPGQTTDDVTILGPQSEVATVVTALTRSHLFSTVVVKM